MTAVEVFPAGTKTLTELAAIANEKHLLVESHVVGGLVAAIECGEVLMDARARVRQGEWTAWCFDNLKFTRHAAGWYIKLAAHKDALPPEAFRPFISTNGKNQQPTMGRALTYLKGLSSPFESGPRRRLSPEIREDAKRLRKQGLTYTQVAELLGISHTSVLHICDPDARQRARANTNKRKRRETAARRALVEQERRDARDLAAKHSGDARGETYSLIRKALDEAQRAVMAANDPDERAALRDTMTMLHKAEDAIAKALKVAA